MCSLTAKLCFFLGNKVNMRHRGQIYSETVYYSLQFTLTITFKQQNQLKSLLETRSLYKQYRAWGVLYFWYSAQRMYYTSSIIHLTPTPHTTSIVHPHSPYNLSSDWLSVKAVFLQNAARETIIKAKTFYPYPAQHPCFPPRSRQIHTLRYKYSHSSIIILLFLLQERRNRER